MDIIVSLLILSWQKLKDTTLHKNRMQEYFVFAKFVYYA